MALTLSQGMAVTVFAVGIVACVSGLWTILSREYQRALKAMTKQSHLLHSKAVTEMGIVPVIDSSARLVDAVNRLIRTAMGVGAFLCLMGLALVLVGYWMLQL